MGAASGTGLLRKRVGARWGVAVGLLLATVAHGRYWYWPRERTGLASPRAVARLDESGWDAVLWIPFPHQNLGALERRVGDVRAWFALLAGESRGAAERVPGFGPFAVPPARELVVATAEKGTRVRIELEAYPTVHWLAWAAGKLARNPWLAGGAVRWQGAADARVTWEGGVWVLTAGEATAESRTTERGVTGRVLAQLRLGHDVRLLPAGLYRLVRGGAGIELLLGEPPPVATATIDGRPAAPAAWILETEGKRGAVVRAVWREEGALDDFPALVVLGRGAGAGRLRVPGEEVLRLAGRSPATLHEAGFELRSLSNSDAERGVEIARRFAALLGHEGDLRAAASVDPRAMGDIARRLGRRLQGLPVIALAGFDPGRIADLLSPWEGCGISRLEVWRRPARVRWLLCPEPEPLPPR